MSDGATDDDKKIQRLKRKIKTNFCICFSGIFFSFSAFRAVLDLQSSINIQHGLGSVSGTTINVMGIVSALTVTPVILIKLGPKMSLILCEVYYLLYVAANFYPVFPTMIPGSIFAGMAESLVFPAMSIYSVYFAIEYSRYGSKTKEEYINDFAGTFFGVVYVTHMVGNLITYLVMRLDSKNGAQNSTEASFASNSSSITTKPTGAADLTVCGSRDCQDPNVTLNNLSQYVAEKNTTYLLLSLFCLLILVAILIHWCATPAIWSDHHVSAPSGQSPSPTGISKQLVTVEDDRSGSCEESLRGANGADTDVTKCNRKPKQHLLSFIYRTQLNMLQQLISPKQLLLAGIQFYTGVELAVVMAEISRAYISCIWGVQQVGLGLIAYGMFSGISALLSGKFASRFGRNIPLFLAFAIDLSAYIICLIWEPSKDAVWLVYVICGAFGFTSGVWQTLTNAMCTDYFHERREISFAAWNMFICCGISLQFGWGTLMCVDKKLYADIALLCFAVLTYGIAELVYQRKAVVADRPNTTTLMKKETTST